MNVDIIGALAAVVVAAAGVIIIWKRTGAPKPDLDRLVPLTAFTNQTEADLLRMHLQAVGIESSVFGRNISQRMTPLLEPDLGVRVMVRAADFERAQELLRRASS